MEKHPGCVPAQGPLTDIRNRLLEGRKSIEKEHTVLVAQHEHIKPGCSRAILFRTQHLFYTRIVKSEDTAKDEILVSTPPNVFRLDKRYE